MARTASVGIGTRVSWVKPGQRGDWTETAGIRFNCGDTYEGVATGLYPPIPLHDENDEPYMTEPAVAVLFDNGGHLVLDIDRLRIII